MTADYDPSSYESNGTFVCELLDFLYGDDANGLSVRDHRDGGYTLTWNDGQRLPAFEHHIGSPLKAESMAAWAAEADAIVVEMKGRARLKQLELIWNTNGTCQGKRTGLEKKK